MAFSNDAHVMYDTVEVWEMDDTEVDWLAMTAGVNFHLTKPESKFDLFIGPFLGYASVDDAKYDFSGVTHTAKLDNQMAWGISLGFDVPAREGWGFYGGVRYFNLELEVAGEEDLEFDISPLVVGHRRVVSLVVAQSIAQTSALAPYRVRGPFCIHRRRPLIDKR